LETLAKEHGLSYSSLFSFLGEHWSTHCFNISDTCPFLVLSFSLFRVTFAYPQASFCNKVFER
jgi:hypothetical protein